MNTSKLPGPPSHVPLEAVMEDIRGCTLNCLVVLLTYHHKPQQMMKEFLCRLKNKEKISGTSHKTYKLRGIISTVLLRIRKSLPSVNSYHFQVICLILNVGLLSDILVHPYKLLSDSQRSHFLSHPFLCVAILLSYPTCQTPPPPPSLSLVTFSFKIS